MGMFKWYVKLGEYGEFIADGWVKANSIIEAESKVKEHYTNCYHTVVIDDDYDFFGDEDLMRELEHYTVYENGVIVRWEH